MRINNMLPVTLFAASLFVGTSICAQTSSSTSKFKPKPTYTAHLSVGQVFFGTGDVNGYGLLMAVEKSVFKKSVRPFPAFQVGFGLNFETGIRKPVIFYTQMVILWNLLMAKPVKHQAGPLLNTILSNIRWMDLV